MASIKGIWCPVYAEREKPDAASYFCRETLKSHFPTETRIRILNDLNAEETRLLKERVSAATKAKRLFSTTDAAVKEQAQHAIANYYDLSVRTLRDWAKKYTEGKIATQPRSGKPRIITSPLKKRIVDLANENNGRSVRAVAAKLKAKVPKRGEKRYETRYNGKQRAHPCKTSVRNVLSEGISLSLKRRPKLTKENQKVRYDYAIEQLTLSDEQRNDNVVAIDESWISLDKAGTGVLVQHPKATPLSNKQKVRTVRNKNHPDKILVLAVIARPKMLNKETAGLKEPAKFCGAHHGKVAIMRCVEEQKYKKRVYQKVNGEKVLKHDVGDIKYVSVTIDGERYKEFLTRDHGVFDQIRNYFGDDIEVRMQEDGAPGHGYNNKNNRSPTKVHDEMVAVGEARKIKVFKQPHNSPELNPLDLGIWHSLQSKVKHSSIEGSSRENDAYIESKIWEATKSAFWNIPARTIWNCWMVKDEVLKALVKNKGKPIAREPHSGVRNRWGTHDPDD